MPVKDVMTRNEVTMAPKTRVENEQLFLDHQIGEVPVVDGSGGFVGEGNADIQTGRLSVWNYGIGS
tara:strand:- start:12613 stop:12810 length:198 start_codon:yes stop_codon:yes gene_type:complete